MLGAVQKLSHANSGLWKNPISHHSQALVDPPPYHSWMICSFSVYYQNLSFKSHFYVWGKNSHFELPPHLFCFSHYQLTPTSLGTWDSFLYSPFVALNIIWTGIWPPVHKASLGNSPVSQTHQESWTGKRLPNHISSIGKNIYYAFLSIFTLY